MGPDAPEAWARVHVQRHVACLCLFAATIISITTFTTMLVAVQTQFSPRHHCLLMDYASNACFFWRNGVVECKCQRHAICIAIALAALITLVSLEWQLPKNLFRLINWLSYY
eukprot:jgi/Ulvmu1/10782/UM069_0016.1